MSTTMRAVRTSSRRARRGFTLLELATTIALITLLSVLTIVAFRAVVARSESAAADTVLDTVRSAQLRFAGVYGTFTPDPDDLDGVPATITVAVGPVSQPNTVSIAVGAAGSLALATVDTNGTCHALQISVFGAQSSAQTVAIPDTALCEARAALPAGEAAVPVSSARW